MFYFNYTTVISLHDVIIEELWWLQWIKDEQQIASIIQHIQNDDYYPTIVDKSVHLFFSIIQFHCFNDGNKRTAVAFLDVFLQVNGVMIDDFYIKLEDIAVGVAKWNLDKEYLKKFFETLFVSFWYQKYLK